MNKEFNEAFGRLEQILFPGVAAEKKGEFPGVDVTDPVASAVAPVETKQVVQSAGEPLFMCQECGKKFYTTASAERATNNGCPKCGGVDIDTYVKSSKIGPMNDLVASLRSIERSLR